MSGSIICFANVVGIVILRRWLSHALIIRGCFIGIIVGRSGVTGADKTDCERPHETVTAEEESSITGKPTVEKELATDEGPAIEEWRVEWARMHKHNRIAEVAKPPASSSTSFYDTRTPFAFPFK